MFWKKKTPDIDIILDDTDEQRKSYRYCFKKGQELFIQFKNTRVRVLNISAGGMAFENNDFQQFDADFIKFTLDIPNFTGDPDFFAGLRILKIDADNICHCIFEQCSIEQHELIHKYVLEMQKIDLRNRKDDPAY